MRITKVINVKDHLEEVKSILSERYEAKKIAHGVQFRLDGGIVSLYTSGKLVFQGDDTAFQTLVSLLPHEEGTSLEFPSIGCDEAGKGEYLGPMVVACVWIDSSEEYTHLRDLGLMDSKEIGKRLPTVYEELKKIVGKHIKVTYKMLTPIEFDRAYIHSGNIARILDWMYVGAIYRLPPASHIIVDQYSTKMLLGELVKNVVSQVRAERFYHVAAASVVAKMIYDKWVSENVPPEVRDVLKMNHVSIDERKKVLAGRDISRWVKNAFKSEKIR